MLPLDKKKEMNNQVDAIEKRMEVLKNTHEKLNMIEDFNKRLGVFNVAVTEMETWLSDARGRIDDIIKPSQVFIMRKKNAALIMRLCLNIEHFFSES